MKSDQDNLPSLARVALENLSSLITDADFNVMPVPPDGEITLDEGEVAAGALCALSILSHHPKHPHAVIAAWLPVEQSKSSLRLTGTALAELLNAVVRGNYSSVSDEIIEQLLVTVESDPVEFATAAIMTLGNISRVPDNLRDDVAAGAQRTLTEAMTSKDSEAVIDMLLAFTSQPTDFNIKGYLAKPITRGLVEVITSERPSRLIAAFNTLKTLSYQRDYLELIIEAGAIEPLVGALIPQERERSDSESEHYRLRRDVFDIILRNISKDILELRDVIIAAGAVRPLVMALEVVNYYTLFVDIVRILEAISQLPIGVNALKEAEAEMAIRNAGPWFDPQSGNKDKVKQIYNRLMGSLTSK
jgi:hypothetical protein